MLLHLLPLFLLLLLLPHAATATSTNTSSMSGFCGAAVNTTVIPTTTTVAAIDLANSIVKLLLQLLLQ